MPSGHRDLVAQLRLTPDEAIRHAAAVEIGRLRAALKQQSDRVLELERALSAISAHVRAVKRSTGPRTKANA